MEMTPVQYIKTPGQATDLAIDWQRWMSGEDISLSYGELATWQAYFREIARKFPELTDEFKENGIL